MSMRHAGIHFPNMAEHPSLAAIARLPGCADGVCLMLSTEARYHWEEFKAAAPRCTMVWRAIPRQGKLPAQLGWDRKRVADEVLNLWDEAEHVGPEWFVPLNELQFSEKENGGPWPGYQQMAQNLAALRVELRSRLPDNVKVLFPAWVPSDDGTYLDQWRQEAEQFDGLCIHCYGDAETMRSRYQSYRDAFPGMPILVGEHNANHTGADERASLQMWADVAASDPLLIGCTYYIYETQNAGEQDFSIWGDDERLALFVSPPVIVPIPDPVPITPTEPQPMTRDEIIALIVQKANGYGLVPWELLGGAIAESALDPAAWREGVWPDWSAGLFQQTVRFAEEGDQSASEENVALIKRLYFDPVHACDVAAMKFKYWRYNPDVPALTAWVAYNSPGFYHTPESSPNVENYRRGLAEAQSILGISPPASHDTTYGPDVPGEVILQHNAWSCAVRSTYAALWSMAQMGHGEPVTYGDEGPRDVYEWMVPQYDDPSVGLHDHTGSGLVQMLKSHGYDAANLYPASLASVQARAGLQPVLLGGDRWAHWVAVRGLESDGTLILENPAPGFGGIDNELRDSFGRLGPMAMVWLTVPTAPGGDVTEAEAAALKAENQHLRDMLGYASHDIANAIQKEIDTCESSLGALQAANDTLKQQTPPAA